MFCSIKDENQIKRYLKMIGFVLLIIIIYLAASMLVSFIASFSYGVIVVFNMAVQGEPIDEGSILELSEMIERFLLSNVQLLSTAGAVLAVLGIWLLFLVIGRNFWQHCRIKKIPLSHLVVALFLGAGTSLFLYGLLTVANLEKIFPSHRELAGLLVKHESILLVLFTVGIITPALEEIVFRGVIFNRFREDLKIVPAVVLQAVFFGLVHFNILQSAYTFLLGILLAFVFVWADSLLVPIFVHIGINLTSVLVETWIGDFPLIFIPVGMALLVAAMLYYKKEGLIPWFRQSCRGGS